MIIHVFEWLKCHWDVLNGEFFVLFFISFCLCTNHFSGSLIYYFIIYYDKPDESHIAEETH